MNETYAQLLSQVACDPHAMAKALAHFLFREVVEDIHSEGKITDAEMMQLNKTVLNRAAYLTEYVLVKRKCIPVHIQIASFVYQSK